MAVRWIGVSRLLSNAALSSQVKRAGKEKGAQPTHPNRGTAKRLWEGKRQPRAQLARALAGFPYENSRFSVRLTVLAKMSPPMKYPLPYSVNRLLIMPDCRRPVYPDRLKNVLYGRRMSKPIWPFGSKEGSRYRLKNWSFGIRCNRRVKFSLRRLVKVRYRTMAF